MSHPIRGRGGRPSGRPTPNGITSVSFSDHVMVLHLADGCVLTVPYRWIPHLRRAPIAVRRNCCILPDGRVHWPDLRATFSVPALLDSARAPWATVWSAASVDNPVENRAQRCGYRVEKYQKTVN